MRSRSLSLMALVLASAGCASRPRVDADPLPSSATEAVPARHSPFSEPLRLDIDGVRFVGIPIESNRPGYEDPGPPAQGASTRF